MDEQSNLKLEMIKAKLSQENLADAQHGLYDSAGKETAQTMPALGSDFNFGNWVYTDDGQVRPLRWKVLKVDSDKQGILLITKDCIDRRQCDETKQYNNTMVWLENSKPPYTYQWKNSTLFHWLNTEFFNNCFNEREKQMILEQKDEQQITSEQTKAKGPLVNLLSAKQVGELMPNKADRISSYTPFLQKKWLNNNSVSWWLSDTTPFKTDAAMVSDNGTVSEETIINNKPTRRINGVDVHAMLGVRPVIFITFSNAAI